MGNEDMKMLLGLLLLLLEPFTVLAQPVPYPGWNRPPIVYSAHAQGQKDHKQYCYTDLTVDASGHWEARTKFSNGKQIDGDHFMAVLVVDNAAGGQAIALQQEAGVRAEKFCNGSCERDVFNQGQIPAGIPLGNWTYLCSGYDEWDDLLISQTAIKIGMWAFGVPSSPSPIGP